MPDSRLKPKWISSGSEEEGVLLVADGLGGFKYSTAPFHSHDNLTELESITIVDNNLYVDGINKTLFELDENGDLMPIL
jgi:hypothetical protein